MTLSPTVTGRERSKSKASLHTVELLPNRTITTPDGVELAGDLFLPRGASPGPALVTMIPYHKDGVGGVTVWDANHYFAARGYASLLVDVRGTGASGGRPRRPLDAGEAEDGLAVVEWAAAQPWCDGNVGMWGVSSGAVFALGTASLNPRPLKAIAPVMGFLDPERDFVHPAGQRGCMAALGNWGLTTLAFHLTPPIRQDPDGHWRRRWRERLECEPYLVDLLRHGPGDPEWRSREIDATRIKVPTFCVAGWRDLYCEASIRAFEQIQAPKKLLVGPWMHTMPDESPFEAVDFLSMAVNWWDRWLRHECSDAPTDEAPVTVYVQGRGVWLDLPAWPPTDTRCERMSASADASLPDDAQPIGPGLVEQPVDATVGVQSGLWGMPTRGFGLPRDQHEDDAKSLAFTSAPLDGPIEIRGHPAATVTARVEAGPERPLVVRLTHVAPDGRSTLITCGTGSLPAVAARDLADHGSAVTRATAIRMIPTAYEVPAGHRLRLTIAAGDFPRLWPIATEKLAVVCGRDDTFVRLPIVPTTISDEPVGSVPEMVRPCLSLVLRANPLYTVTHDAVSSEVTVTMGEHLLVKSPTPAATIDMNGFVSVTVAAQRPKEASLRGKVTVRVRTSGGAHVVRAEIELTDESATIAGTVAIAGEELVSRRWTV